MKNNLENNTVIDTETQRIKLLTTVEVCQLMHIKQSTFYRYYSNQLTCYKNADNQLDKKHYFNEKEVIELIEKKGKKPNKFILKRKPKNKN